jgi:galactonate dehydratase
MRIADIKVYNFFLGTRNQCLVKVETDTGIYGWGESGVSSREWAVEGAVRHYREWLIGRDPMRRGSLWQEMYRGQYFEGGRVLLGAISAIDCALYDIAGKALGVPVYELLGGAHREFVPLFATTLAPMGPRLIDESRLLVEQGWGVIRYGIFAGPPVGEDPLLFEPRESMAETAEWSIRLREAVGRKPILVMDYHKRLSVAEAAAFCQMVPPGTFDVIEEPIRPENPDAYAALRAMTNVGFAFGTEYASKWAYLPFIERGLMNYARIDVCNVGGLTEAMKVASLAEAHYIDLMPHNAISPVGMAAMVHMAIAVPNFAWLEIRRSPTEDQGFYDEIAFPLQPTIQGDHILLPTGPGLGVEVNEEVLLPPTYYEMPHLRRRDGSVQNW